MGAELVFKRRFIARPDLLIGAETMEIQVSWWSGESEDPEILAAGGALIAEAGRLQKEHENLPPTLRNRSAIHIYLVDADDPREALSNRLLTLFTAKHADPFDPLTPKPTDPFDEFGVFLFLTRSRGLGPWTDSDNKNHGHLKAREFFIRTLSSYSLAKVIPVPAGAGHRQPVARLHRLILGDREWRHVGRTISEIADGIGRLQEVARRELPRHFSHLAEIEAEVRTSIEDAGAFIRTLASLHQLGRRPQSDAESAVRVGVPWLRGFSGSYLLRRQINALLVRTPGDGTSADSQGRVDQLGILQAMLRCYEVFRDLARWLASGAFHWAKNLRRLSDQGALRLPAGDETGQPKPARERGKLRVLVIDEILAPDEGEDEDFIARPLREALRTRLRTIRDAFAGDVSFEYVVHPVWSSVKSSLAAASPGAIEVADLDAEYLPRTSASRLEDYHVILVEVEYREEYIGPQIVQALASYFDRLAATGEKDPFARTQPALRRAPPSIIVLTQSVNADHVQKCLNFGADAFVRKERIYELPTRATRVRILHEGSEPRGSRSNFRSLYQLTHAELATLQSSAPDNLIRGRRVDVIDHERLRRLPKADLHTHIGTSIALPTIQALALNTFGHACARRGQNPELRPMLEQLARHLWAVVLLAGWNFRDELDAPPSARIRAAVRCMWKASVQISRSGTPGTTSGWEYDARAGDGTFPGEDVFDKIIQRVQNAYPQFETYEITALLVTILAIWETREPAEGPPKDAPDGRWDYLERVPAVLEKALERGDPASALFQERVKRAESYLRRFAVEGAGAYPDLPNSRGRPAPSLCALTRQQVRARLREARDLVQPQMLESWKHLHAVLQPPVSGGADEALARVRVPSLATLVAIPPDPALDERTLKRYLWGTGLLGADHLQYPENLLLAANALVTQAAEENILYTELRCETIGYTRAGLGAIDATDLLCVALDVAVLLGVLQPEIAGSGEAPDRRSSPRAVHRRWTRVNVLLGAKRHKANATVGEIAELVAYYLQRRDADPLLLAAGAPAWWKPSAVVGFDLSGKEEKKGDDHVGYIQPLFKYSAPITIHAGEQQPPEIIWEAVYRYGARRIGHGLRLRENLRLLDYCIREGICMELCPISNRFTNGFPVVERAERYQSRWREYYPLRYYLDRGLDVCINTDNRQLHGERSLLTDEYMAAAELAGGLTAWEVFRIVKCGFKHAFIPKDEVALLLGAVEERIVECLEDFL